MNQTTRILINTGSTEPSSFRELLRGMGDDAPEAGDRKAWAEFFGTIRSLESLGLIEVERESDGRIENMQLTSLGAERAREALKGGRS
jgi:hypothetical protein